MNIGQRIVVTHGVWAGRHGTVKDHDVNHSIQGIEDIYLVEWDQPNMLEGLDQGRPNEEPDLQDPVDVERWLES